jgi:FtsH-binding integral membrane protein
MTTPPTGVSLGMGSQARSDTVEARRSSLSLRVALASIWAYALASGLIALGVTELITAVVPPGQLRFLLELATVVLVAVTAGLACQNTLTRLRSFLTAHRHVGS